MRFPLFGALLLLTQPAFAAPEWLDLLNEYRAQAGLGPVVEDRQMSEASALHAKYSTTNNRVEHYEFSNLPDSTPWGHWAGTTSNGSWMGTAREAIDDWMAAPFHAIGMIDPRLQSSGFGSHTAHGRSSSWLNVIAGLGPLPAQQFFPIAWPGNGRVTRLTSHRGEIPPLDQTCPYGYPMGLPVILQLAPGASTQINYTEFRDESQTLDHCAFNERSYQLNDNDWRNTARAILRARNAIILVPKKPLKRGSTYTVVIETPQRNWRWSFSVSR